MEFEHFCCYREYVERRYPIEADVLACGLSAVPAKLEEWRTCAAAFDALDAEAADGGDAAPAAGRLSRTSFQQLCFECGSSIAASNARTAARPFG